MNLPTTLRAAVTLAETGHFGRAADRLYMSQPGFSGQIARLEQELGVQLFDRTPRGVRLTAAGAAYTERAQKLLDDLESAASEARQIGEGSAGEIRVGIFGPDPAELMPWILAAAREAWPELAFRFVELSMVDQFDRLLEKSVDVAFLRSPIHDERMLTQPLFAEPRVAALPIRHPLAEADQLTVSDLLDEPFPTPVSPVPPEWRSFWTCDTERGEPSRKAADVSTIGECLAAVAYLDAVDTWPLSGTRLFRHHAVRFIPVDAPFSVLTIARRRDDDRPGIRAFCELAVNVTREHLGVVDGAVPPERALTTIGSSQ